MTPKPCADLANPGTMRSVEKVLTTTNLKELVLEHVMRVANDELSVLPFVDAEPGTPQAYEALGRLLGDVNVPLQSGTPLVVFCSGGDVRSDWRRDVVTAPDALWGTLEMLVALYGDVDEPSPYAKYCRLRDIADADLPG